MNLSACEAGQSHARRSGEDLKHFCHHLASGRHSKAPTSHINKIHPTPPSLDITHTSTHHTTIASLSPTQTTKPSQNRTSVTTSKNSGHQLLRARQSTMLNSPVTEYGGHTLLSHLPLNQTPICREPFSPMASWFCERSCLLPIISFDWSSCGVEYLQESS